LEDLDCHGSGFKVDIGHRRVMIAGLMELKKVKRVARVERRLKEGCGVLEDGGWIETLVRSEVTRVWAHKKSECTWPLSFIIEFREWIKWTIAPGVTESI
jgi:hypothetical protein